MAAIFRATTYYIEKFSNNADQFGGQRYDLELTQDLAENYFVLISGAGSGNQTLPRDQMVRVEDDPFETGDLGDSGASDIITLRREDGDGYWVGNITVIECLEPDDPNGFKLADVKAAMLDYEEYEETFTAGTPWTDVNQVVPFGGLYGGGVSTPSSYTGRANSVFVKIALSSTDTYTLKRWERDPLDLIDRATFTIYAVEWGSNWTIQKSNLTTTLTSEVSTSTSITTIDDEKSWVWQNGFSNPTFGAGNGPIGINLWMNTAGSLIYNEFWGKTDASYTMDVEMRRYVMTHDSLAVDHDYQGSGASADSSDTYTVPSPVETETRGYTGQGASGEKEGNQYTLGSRFGFQWHSTKGLGFTAIKAGVWYARHTADTTLTVERFQSGQDWVGRAQSIDLGNITETSDTDNSLFFGMNF
jgi:hypothetical protein